jgi:hypothetical protein
MPDARIAESILALVTARDRAATTVGDLLEQSATYGNAWFWSRVFRTATSLLWRGFADNAARITGVALLGLVLDGVLGGLFAFLTGIAFFVVAYVTGNPGAANSVAAGDSDVAFAAGGAWSIWLVAPTLLASFWIGRLISRWAIGRELPATVAYIVLVPVASLIVGLFFQNGPTATQLAPIFLADLAQRLPALAGAALSRRRLQSKSVVSW